MARFMYVSLQKEDRIAIFEVDRNTGGLEPRGEAPLIGQPAPLAMDPSPQILFAGRRKAQEFGLSSFRVAGSTGQLSPVRHIPLAGDPVYLATDRRGRFLLSAYYHQERVAVHRIEEGAALGETPLEWLETGIGAHCILTDPSNRFALVPHIANGAKSGPNAIFQFKFDELTGHLFPNLPDRVTSMEPEGPRHICFHPARHLVYCSNEQGCSVTAYNFDSDAGTLSPLQTISTLPANYEGQNSCSQIQITPFGKFLYAPNRGHNSIACFSVDDGSGRLSSIGQVPAEPMPRAFSLDPEGSFLYVAGLESGRPASYGVGRDTGVLEPMEVYDVGQGPMWVLIADL